MIINIKKIIIESEMLDAVRSQLQDASNIQTDNIKVFNQQQEAIKNKIQDKIENSDQHVNIKKKPIITESVIAAKNNYISSGNVTQEASNAGNQAKQNTLSASETGEAANAILKHTNNFANTRTLTDDYYTRKVGDRQKGFDKGHFREKGSGQKELIRDNTTQNMNTRVPLTKQVSDIWAKQRKR